jgi:ADP-heptose:LPS heptosyltransferase
VSRPRPALVVLRALGLGDLLTGVPALRGLARAFPDHRRVLLTPASLAPLVHWSGTGFEVVDMRGVLHVGPLPPGIHGQGEGRAPGAGRVCMDVAVNLHGRGPQSHRALLDRRPRRLIAFRHEHVWREPVAPRWRVGEPERDRWTRLLAAHGIAADPDDLDLAVPAADVQQVPPAWRDATVVHAGAGSPARCWPLDRWAAVVRHERSLGRTVLLTGSIRERPLTRALRRATRVPIEHDLAGRTDPALLAALVNAAGVVVCGDTGVAHLATAVGTPSVVLFGPSTPDEWGPPPSRRIHRVLWAGRAGDPHGSSPDPGLLAIGVDEVFDALAALRDQARGDRVVRPVTSAGPSRSRACWPC